MRFSVKILGAGSATPALGRHPTSQLLSIDNDLYLIDCGEGTQYRLLEQRAKVGKLRAIFISHLHGDHYLGLTGLLSTLNMGGRTEPLLLFGPKGLNDIITLQFAHSDTRLEFPLRYHQNQTELSQLIYENDHVAVTTVPLDHRVHCCGFLFQEKSQPRNLIKEKLTDEMPFECLKMLKQGLDATNEAGTTYRADEYTHPPTPLRSYAFCSDTRYDERIVPLVRGATLLYHEATFLNEKAQRATDRYHATAEQAGMIAHKAQVGRLIIGHFSATYREFSAFLDEARAVFANTDLALEGTEFDV